LVKVSGGRYRGVGLSRDETVEARREQFLGAVELFQPGLVLIDRHPYGIAGELRDGLLKAGELGARIVLSLRDVLDDPAVIAGEMAEEGWVNLPETFDSVMVYGSREFCDHEDEYGLPMVPHYCGWVVEPPDEGDRDPQWLVVTAGGGADGAAVYRLGVETAELRPDWKVTLLAGPYAQLESIRGWVSQSVANRRVRIEVDVPGCGPWFASAGAALQMAGYNSTFESLAAGIRPLLVPRRHPRTEQLLRAHRLAALGLADVLDQEVGAVAVSRLLDQPQSVTPEQLESAGISLNGARKAATFLVNAAAGARDGQTL
jgi:predicted glycosyltransferase